MKRRTLLGSAAMTLGGASVIGTGAFTSVRAERSISVDVVGDKSAFLQLRPTCESDGDSDGENNEVGDTSGDSSLRSSDFVYTKDDGTIAVDLTGSIHENGGGNIDGDGITKDSLWRFPNAFEVANQGTQPVAVDFEVRNEGEEGEEVTIGDDDVQADVGGETREFEDDDPAAVFYPGSNDAPGNLFNDEGTDGLVLEPSESQCIGFNVRTFGFEADNYPFSNATLRITADASVADDVDNQPQAGLGISLNQIDDQPVGEAFDITGDVENNSPDGLEDSTVGLEILDENGENVYPDKGELEVGVETGTENGFEFGGITLNESGSYTARVTATADDDEDDVNVAPVSDSVDFNVTDSADYVSGMDPSAFGESNSRLKFNIKASQTVIVDGIRFEEPPNGVTRVLLSSSNNSSGNNNLHPEVQFGNGTAISIENSLKKNSLFFYTTSEEPNRIDSINNKDLPAESQDGFYPFDSAGSGEWMTNGNNLTASSQTLDPEETTVKIGKFRSDDTQGNSETNLKGKNVTLSLRFNDGSTKQFQFEDIQQEQ